jgi:broad specificity phosphatase PhoE
MSRTITFIRHAQQTSHREIDPPIIQAPSPIDVPYDLIITSPYLRTRQTAQAVNGYQKPIYVDVRISEYQGHKAPKKIQLDAGTIPFNPIPLYNETWSECQKRLDQHWEYVKSLNQNVLVVTHGVVVNYIYEKITGKKMYKRGRDVPFGNGFTVRI